MIHQMNAPIYLDHNATTPVLPEVADAIRACHAEPYLNPASQHAFGRRARHALEEARERIAELLGANVAGRDADSVFFTSGGTEANNLAVQGLLQAPPGEGRFSGPETKRHLILSPTEHPSIYRLAEHLAHTGWHVDQLAVDGAGVVRVDRLPELLRPETRLVCVILGQNETGVVQPVAELAAICRERGVPLHTDAAQAAGKLAVNFRALGAATMSVAAHKFGGPLGIGALVVRHGTSLAPQMFGGFQQAGLRPGTESVALAVGMRTALEAWAANRDAWLAHLESLRNHFESQLKAADCGAVVLGELAPRLPQTSNVAFPGVDRQAMFLALDQAGVACSTGSACASGSSEPSPVHLAMGLDLGLISSALRFSFGISTTPAQADEATRRILKICNELRRQKQA
jgi:cysteine desulfurase